MWSKDEIEFLIQNYSTNSNADLMSKLDKSVGVFNAQVLKLGLKKNIEYIKLINKKRVLDKLKEEAWSKKDIDILVSNLDSMNNSELATLLNRSSNSIVSMCGRLGIKRIGKYNKEFIEKECMKYITKSELKISDPNLYHWLYKNGKMKDLSTHMLNISYSTPQLILSHVMKELTKIPFNYNDRIAIKPYEIDIYFPAQKFGIEYDGSYYHDEGASFKKDLCIKNNITLIVIDDRDISTTRGFDSYLNNIKKKIVENLNIINEKLDLNLLETDVFELVVDKSQIFKGLFDLSNIKQICDKYDNYSIFLKEQRKVYNKLYYLGLLEDYTSHMKVEKIKESLKYIIESKNYYKVGDIVLIEYWYNGMICPTKIIDITGRTYTVSHNIKESKIFNAPDEKLKTSNIIDIYRTSNRSNAD